MNSTIRVMIVDDHAIVREGLRTLLADEAGFLVVGEARTGTEALQVAPRCQPDVVLMDLMMPEMDGIESTRQLRALLPTCQVLVLSSFVDDDQVRGAVQAGAMGYLLKDVLKEPLLRALRAAARGEPTLHPQAQHALIRHTQRPASPLAALTEREREVLGCLAEGMSNREIARTLHLTEGTVKGYVSIILDKLGVADRTQAALLAVRHGVGS